MAKIKISVTQTHIDLGLRRSCVACPIALAVKSYGFKSSHVGYSTIWAEGLSDRVPTPPAAKEFIHAFDGREKVEPFEFELGVPDAG